MGTKNHGQRLFERVLNEVSELSPSNLSIIDDLKNVPRVLFHGFTPAEAVDIVKAKMINPNGSLRWYTFSLPRAALAYGFSIPKEVQEAQRREGLIRPDGSFTDEYGAAKIKNNRRYVLVVFPQNYNLKPWILARNQPTVFVDSSEYITDLTFPLSQVVFARLGDLNSVKISDVQDRDDLLKKLRVSESDQKEVLSEMGKYLGLKK
ncbi:MAG: hypothetical protein GXO93_07625 [FCB group bacterium]|nr:hypothetical protein [FCB group bacterium]